MEETRLIVSSSPHVRAKMDTPAAMRAVIIALLPAALGSIYFFGIRAALVMIVSVAAAVGTEAAIEALGKKPLTVKDYSAAVTGLLLAMVLPPTIPLWTVIIANIVAIGIAKMIFGGLGANPFNPALIGRAFVVASWPVLGTAIWMWPHTTARWADNFDAVSTATPLTLLKMGELAGKNLSQFYPSLLWGNVAGSLGETSALLLLVGGLYLIWKGIIDWKTPASYIATVAVVALLFGQDPIFHVLAGGLMIGAFFMATDWVTSPITPKGRVIFGIGAGILTVLIRLYGGYPEGVAYSILLMNATVPLIDRYARPRRFGEVKRHA